MNVEKEPAMQNVWGECLKEWKSDCGLKQAISIKKKVMTHGPFKSHEVLLFIWYEKQHPGFVLLPS